MILGRAEDLNATLTGSNANDTVAKVENFIEEVKKVEEEKDKFLDNAEKEINMEKEDLIIHNCKRIHLTLQSQQRDLKSHVNVLVESILSGEGYHGKGFSSRFRNDKVKNKLKNFCLEVASLDQECFR